MKVIVKRASWGVPVCENARREYFKKKGECKEHIRYTVELNDLDDLCALSDEVRARLIFDKKGEFGLPTVTVYDYPIEQN